LVLLSEEYTGIPEMIATQETIVDIENTKRSFGGLCEYRQAGLKKQRPDVVSLQQAARGRGRWPDRSSTFSYPAEKKYSMVNHQDSMYATGLCQGSAEILFVLISKVPWLEGRIAETQQLQSQPK
jgi:hypothetical protein